MKKDLITLALFLAGVLLFTYLDFVVNSVLYGFGLRFDYGWYDSYSLGYLLLFQFLILALTVYCKSWRRLVLMEAFVLSSTQDLVYFGVWSGCVFPVGDWTWMPLYETLGFYSTGFQVLLSTVCISSAMLLIKVVKKCGCYYPASVCWRCQIKQVWAIIKNRFYTL